MSRSRTSRLTKDSDFVVGAKVLFEARNINDVVTDSKEGQIVLRNGDSLSIHWDNSAPGVTPTHFSFPWKGISLIPALVDKTASVNKAVSVKKAATDQNVAESNKKSELIKKSKSIKKSTSSEKDDNLSPTKRAKANDDKKNIDDSGNALINNDPTLKTKKNQPSELKAGYVITYDDQMFPNLGMVDIIERIESHKSSNSSAPVIYLKNGPPLHLNTWIYAFPLQSYKLEYNANGELVFVPAKYYDLMYNENNKRIQPTTPISFFKLIEGDLRKQVKYCSINEGYASYQKFKKDQKALGNTVGFDDDDDDTENDDDVMEAHFGKKSAVSQSPGIQSSVSLSPGAKCATKAAKGLVSASLKKRKDNSDDNGTKTKKIRKATVDASSTTASATSTSGTVFLPLQKSINDVSSASNVSNGDVNKQTKTRTIVSGTKSMNTKIIFDDDDGEMIDNNDGDNEQNSSNNEQNDNDKELTNIRTTVSSTSVINGNVSKQTKTRITVSSTNFMNTKIIFDDDDGEMIDDDDGDNEQNSSNNEQNGNDKELTNIRTTISSTNSMNTKTIFHYDNTGSDDILDQTNGTAGLKESATGVTKSYGILAASVAVACSSFVSSSFVSRRGIMDGYIRKQWLQNLIELLFKSDALKGDMLMIEGSVPNSGMILDRRTCYSARYIPPSEFDTGHLVINYSSDTHWVIDMKAHYFQQMFHDNVFTKDSTTDTTVKQSSPQSTDEESLCKQLVDAAKSGGEVSVASIFGFRETLKVLSLSCGCRNDKFSVSKAVWSFGSSLNSKDPTKVELKLLYRFIPSDAILVYLKGEGGKMVPKLFICNTIITLSEGGKDKFILLQILREMCNDFLLHFVLLNMRTNVVSMTRVKQPALFTCLLAEKISEAQLATAAKAYRDFLTKEKMIYDKKRGINASNKKFRSLIESNENDGVNQIIDDEIRYHASEFKVGSHDDTDNSILNFSDNVGDDSSTTHHNLRPKIKTIPPPPPPPPPPKSKGVGKKSATTPSTGNGGSVSRGSGIRGGTSAAKKTDNITISTSNENMSEVISSAMKETMNETLSRFFKNHTPETGTAHDSTTIATISAAYGTALAAKDETLAAKDETLAAKDETLALLIGANDKTTAANEKTIAAKSETIAANEATIAAKNETIAAKEATIAAKDETIALTSSSYEKTIAAKDETIDIIREDNASSRSYTIELLNTVLGSKHQ